MNYKHLVTCHDVLVPWNETPSQHTMTLSLWPRSQNPTERTQILWARGTTWRLFRGPPPGQSSLIHATICHNETQRERERGREGDRDWLLLIWCPRISENAMKHWAAWEDSVPLLTLLSFVALPAMVLSAYLLDYMTLVQHLQTMQVFQRSVANREFVKVSFQWWCWSAACESSLQVARSVLGTEAGAKQTAAATLLSIFSLSAGLEKRYGGGHCRLKHTMDLCLFLNILNIHQSGKILVRFHAEQAECHRQSMSHGMCLAFWWLSYVGPGLHLGNRALFDVPHRGYESCNGSWLGLPSLEAGWALQQLHFCMPYLWTIARNMCAVRGFW